MAVRFAINGFGRIGRLVARIATTRSDLELVAINDITDAATLCHLMKYDSVHGKPGFEVTHDDTSISIVNRRVRVTSATDPKSLLWRQLGVCYVIESTGKYTSYGQAAGHLAAGAERVIISAPPKSKEGEPPVKSLVMGVNHSDYDPKTDFVISNASCTTNCVVPVAKVLHDNFRIERAYMTTVHAYTNDQRILDQPHKDLRRARAAAVSMIPTSTGAAKLIGIIFPELKGKIDGMAIRVPTADVSVVELACVVQRPVTVEQVNEAFRAAADGALRGILQYVSEPLVSIDFVGNSHSAIFDSGLTAVVDNTLVKVFAWYDNEYGYACRLVDLMEYMAKVGNQ